MDRQMIWIGFDPRPEEVEAFAVARSSVRRRLSGPLPICGLLLSRMRELYLYKRPTVRDAEGRLFDQISNAPMSTEFAISRFLVPTLTAPGFALFLDADVMARANVYQLFEQVDKSKAVSVVKHNFKPATNAKMDGQIQTSYERKNWSSVVMWNCNHPKNRYLTPEIVNSAKGLWLHQFSWLDDHEIGELDPKWNYLVGHSPKCDPAIVHFTDGVPTMKGYENCEYADEWRQELECWAI